MSAIYAIIQATNHGWVSGAGARASARLPAC